MSTPTGPITQEGFDLLPALLSAYQVKAVTGWTDSMLTEAVRAGQVAVWNGPVRPGRKRAYRKYRKASVAVIVGYRI